MNEKQERFYSLCTAYGSINAAEKAVADAVTQDDADADIEDKARECVRYLRDLRELILGRIRSVA